MDKQKRKTYTDIWFYGIQTGDLKSSRGARLRPQVHARIQLATAMETEIILIILTAKISR
jgi:hypothetical protein